MNHIVIVGSGPVGSFMAVLCGMLNFPVTVYEKRVSFTRNINVKLENGFFKDVQEVISQLRLDNWFFNRLDEYVSSQNNKIPIKELEERCSRKAKSLGVRYITQEIDSFEDVYIKHKYENPIILDCTGRNSKLRSREFGPDEDNLVTTPLQHAMYISFKALISGNISSLYQVMKHIKSIKLTEVVVGKSEDENGFKHVTIPVFINNKLAAAFDNEHPDISRNPLNPFNSLDAVSDLIFEPISCIVGKLIVDGCIVDLNSVKVKKIEIFCGYAKKRSKGKYVCLGDSAIHLAFFRSLNLGLKHALQFFIQLSMFSKANAVMHIKEEDVIKEFRERYPHLNTKWAVPTKSRNVYLVVTKVIWYGCFSYCLTNHEMKRLTSPLGVYQSDILKIFKELNTHLSTWDHALDEFEEKRYEDIKTEILSNKTKSMLVDYASFLTDINDKSFIKISEFARATNGKYPLYGKEFDFLLRCFKARKDANAHVTTSCCVNENTRYCAAVNIISNLSFQVENIKFSVLQIITARKDISCIKKIELIRNSIVKNFLAKKCNTTFSKIYSDSSNVSFDFISALIKNELSCIN